MNSNQCHHIRVSERRKKDLFSYIAFFIQEVIYSQHIIIETL